MKKYKNYFLSTLIISSAFLSACSSWFTRQDCKNIDWYKHGYSVAMQGRRLTGDNQVKKCEDAEFQVPYSQMESGFKEGMNNYCLPKVVYSIGKSGDFFNPELCDPGQVRALQAQYQSGVEAYCAAENGFNAGSSGKKYQNICPQKLEPAFLKEYRRGRRAYITGKISEAETNISAVERQSIELERQRLYTQSRLSMLPPAPPNQKPENDRYRHDRENLQNDLNSITGRMNSKLNEKEHLLKLKGEYQAELATLQE